MTLFGRILSMILSMMMLTGPAPAGGPEDMTVYTLPGYLDISIPSQCMVITEDTPEDHGIFKLIGREKDEMIGQFGLSKIALVAFLSGFEDQLYVDVQDFVFYREFSTASDTLLKAVMDANITQWEYRGTYVERYEIYEHAQTRFLKCPYRDEVNGTSGMQYWTMHGGKTYFFCFVSDLDEGDEAMMDAIIDSVVFAYQPD